MFNSDAQGDDRLLIVPVVHARMEPAKRVRRALERFRPDAVAVEIPETLAQPFAKAVARLPLLSILRWRVSDGKFAYLVVEPADGAVEAARWARENGAECACADRDGEAYPAREDLVPDSYALDRLGEARFDELCRAGLAPSDEHDDRREETMAFHVRRLLDAGKRVALVCGAAHAESVRSRLPSATTRPLARTRREVELFHLAEEASREVLGEPPFIQAAYERWRSGAPQEDAILDEESAEIVPFTKTKTGTKTKSETGTGTGSGSGSGSLSTGTGSGAGGGAGAGTDRERDPLIETEPDRWKLVARLSRAAQSRLLDEDGERVSSGALAVLAKMARNWSLLAGRLSPDLVQLVTCARGVGGDDFAYRFWELATAYPWQTARPGLPVLRPTVEDLYDRAAQMRFRLSVKTRRHVLRVVPPRPREKRPGEWKEKWRGDSIVSYPPEDLVIEGYGAFLKKRAVGILASDHSRVEPFTTSLLDGIDLRETIRNLAHDGRIFVRENRPVKGTVGAVVLVFDEDARKNGEERYPWRMTWQGEHAQESDMALYATAPGDKLAGPGISRCEYGGLLLTLPPGRMFHVWEDPFFDEARAKAERLLLAGIDYSMEKLIVYVGPRPPRSTAAAYAARRGKKVVYVPIGQLSPILLKRVRVFHVLDGRRVRAWAGDYIRS